MTAFAVNTYRGSGRLTGEATTDLSVLDSPFTTWVRWTGAEDAFYAQFQWEQHDHCHTNPQWDCPHCEEPADVAAETWQPHPSQGDEF